MIDQPTFDFSAPAHWTDESQIQEAERVAGAIGGTILRWAAARARRGALEFHMEELREHVGDSRAPDSPGRILRLLRQKKILDYRVVNRARSLYCLVNIGGQ